MKTYRKGQKVRFILSETNDIPQEGTYIRWTGLDHKVINRDGWTYNLQDKHLLSVRSRRKYKQPPVWAKFL